MSLARQYFYGDYPDEPWAEANALAAEKLFLTHSGLQNFASLLAATHPYALDYIKQAPALVEMMGDSRRASSASVVNGPRMAAAWKSMVQSGPSLRDLMECCHLAYPLRGLSGRAIQFGHRILLLNLSKINPSTLSQVMPTGAAFQKEWINKLEAWKTQVHRRDYRGAVDENDPVPFLEWAAMHVMETDQPYVEYAVADMARAADSGFNTRWNWAGAERAARQWHRRLAQQSEAERFARNHGVDFDHVIDFTPFADRAKVGPYEFVALNTGRKLFEEGAAMNHCVASYFGPILHGRSRIFSITKDDVRVATIEFQYHERVVTVRHWDDPRPGSRRVPNGQMPRPKWVVAQCKGPYNATPPADILEHLYAKEKK